MTEHGWHEGTRVSVVSLSALVALGRAWRNPDLIYSDFPSLGHGTAEVAEGAGQTWTWGQVWPGLNPAAEAEQRRWEHPMWFPEKYLRALPMALEVSVLY